MTDILDLKSLSRQIKYISAEDIVVNSTTVEMHRS